MQATTFLALLVAHVLGDFLLQTGRQIEAKRRGRWSGHLAHGAAHLLLAEIGLALFLPALVLAPRTHAILLALVALHLAVDHVKEARLPERWRATAGRRAAAFAADQAVHLVLLAVAAALLAGGDPFAAYGHAFAWLQEHAATVLAVAAAYATAVFAGGYVIQIALSPLQERDPAAVPRPGLARAGMYIGWLERTLVISAIVLGALDFVGLVVAAKAIIRFGDKDQPRFAEYFLLGTFLSLLLAGVAGLLLRRLLAPTVAFAP